MMKRLLILSFLVLGMVSQAFAQTAILVRDNQTVSVFYGAASLTNAVNTAEPTGDIIVLSSGTFNNPGEIKKSVSIYGNGHEGAGRTYIQGKLSLRPSEEGSIDNIHLEGLYLENHFNILNDGNRSPISNLTVVKCHVTGIFFYMPSYNVTLKNCIIQGDMKTYPGSYTATNMLIENCWKDGGSFNIFTAESTITVRNSIFNCRGISGFDNSLAFCKATFENSIIAGATLAAGSSATNCVLLNVNTSANGVTTTNCWEASSVSEAFTNAESLVYAEGASPAVKAEYVGADGTPIGITGGSYPWSVVPSQPTVNIETTLVKDADGFYKIGSVEDWKELKRVVETLNPLANARMTADINLGDDQTMIGNGDYNVAANRKPFMGTFDGQGHTLTINYNTTDWEAKTYLGAAPFGYVFNGTIRNLNTAGTITATQEGIAGLIGWTNGNTRIERCHSSVDITFTNERRGAAGLTYNNYNDNHVLTIVDCIYDGTITAGSNKTGSAGLVAYRSYGTVNISNSLVTATFANGMGTSDCATMVRNPSGIISNSFYVQPLNAIQGNQATEEELANGRTAFYLQAGREEMFWGQTIGTDPQPVLTNDESKRVYRSADGYTNNPALAIADQSLIPLLYTRNSDNELTITGLDLGFASPDDYALVIPDEIDGAPVVAIANQAFYRKTNFTSLHIGKNVKTIGDAAFREATSLKTLTFAPDGQLTTISTNAFRYCTSLESVVIPKTVTAMGTSIFEDCSGMTSAAFEEGFTMNYIPDWTFYNNRFANFEIPASVKTINKGVFMNNTALAAIEFPATLTKLGQEVFHNCSSLTQVTIPETITSMDINIFQNSGVVTAEVFCPVIGQGTFYQCANLESVNIHEGVTTIGYGSFHGCTKLPSVVIPSTVTTLSQNAFRECTSMTEVTFAEGIQLTSIGSAAFYNTGLVSVTIPAMVETINSEAFRSSVNLTEVVFPAETQLKTINGTAFANCTKLPSFVMPNTVTTLGNAVFYRCPLLERVTLSNQITALPDETFRECSLLDNVIIPHSVLRMGSSVFRTCTSLSSIIIPNSVTTMGTSVFEDCSALTSAAFEEGTTITNLPDWTFYNTRFASFVIPPSIETIARGVFMNNSALESIVIPNTVKSFTSTETFSGCAALAEATFEEPCQVTSLPNNMFYGAGLLQISIPTSVKTIGNIAFYNCKQMEEVSLPQGLTTIGNSAFRYCEKLNNVVLPGTLNSIQDWAFANCTSLENLTLEEGITSINRDVFQFSGMKKVVLPATLGTIGVNLFHQCNQLEELDLSKCVNVYELYNMTTVQRTGGSGQYNIFFGVPATTKVIMPAYAKVEPAENVVVDKESFDLAQDEEGYYLINNAEAWDKFVVYSRANPTINGRLTADLDLTGHEGKLGIGNGESAYFTWQGTLDGQGHYLTIKYKTNKEFVGGLFAYTENAIIKNLRVRGTVDVIYRVAGGFVGFVKDNLTIQDCESDIAFAVTPSATNMHVTGFVGQGKVGNISFTDCLFKGSIVGKSSFRYAAGFMGWMDSAGRVSYNNCLNIGDVSNVETNYNYPLGATQTSGQSTAAGCYHKTGNSVTNNESLSKEVTIEQLASGRITHRLQGGREEQHWGQKIGTDPMPRLTDEAGTRVYRGEVYTNEPVEENELAQDADGYYLVGTPGEWRRFAEFVSEGEMTNMNVRMTADIDLGLDQTMIGGGQAANDYGGTGSIKYQGIFDGQGHTLRINYIATNAHTAPFRYIQNATIKNLHVEGSITTAYGCAAGIVGVCFGQQIHSYIENCVSSVHIFSSCYNTGGFYSGASHGGIAANLNYYGQLHITDCVFDGSIRGENRDVVWGGMMGIPDGTVTLTNCLQVGEFICSNVIGGGNGSGTFSCVFGNGYASRVYVNNSYYLNQLGNAQGTQATETSLADGSVVNALQAGREEEIWVENPYTNQPMLRLFCENYDPDGISLTPALSREEGVYNLAGQQIVNSKSSGHKLTRGIYIVGGKKVVVN